MSGNKEFELKTKQRKPSRKKILYVVLLTPLCMLIGLGILGAIISESESTKADSKQTAQQGQDEATTQIPRIGTTVSDAGFSFVVNSIKCGEKRISYSDGFINHIADAQGQFCRLNITVTNISDTSNSIRAYNQHVFNAQGQKYDHDAGATGRAAHYELGNPFNDDINPGNNITGDIVFDMPMGVMPTTAELHGDSNSSGVRINLQ